VSPELMLATLAGESNNPVKINRYRSLLSQLSVTYVDSAQGIAETAVMTQKLQPEQADANDSR
jgi:hypothetical protein